MGAFLLISPPAGRIFHWFIPRFTLLYLANVVNFTAWQFLVLKWMLRKFLADLSAIGYRRADTFWLPETFLVHCPVGGTTSEIADLVEKREKFFGAV